MHTKNCKYCDKEFNTKDNRQIYCCHNCYAKDSRIDKTKNCVICDDEFEYSNGYTAKKTCSKECADKLRSKYNHDKETIKKIRNRLKGRKFNKEHKRKISKALTGREFSEEHRNNISKVAKGRTPWNKGKKMSEEFKKKVSEALLNGKVLRGEEHPHWKGGSNLKNRIRKMPEYKEWRKKVFERDDYTCQWCGDDTGGNLNADHYPDYFADIFYDNEIDSIQDARECEEFWNIDNGRTLCEDCHKQTDNYAIKYN